MDAVEYGRKIGRSHRSCGLWRRVACGAVVCLCGETEAEAVGARYGEGVERWWCRWAEER